MEDGISYRDFKVEEIYHNFLSEIDSREVDQKHRLYYQSVIANAPGRGRRKVYCDTSCRNRHNYSGPKPQTSDWPVADGPILHHGPFERFAQAYQDRIDVIITDPPYGRDALPIYESLARFALGTLKVGGWLVCLTGNGIAYEAQTLFRAAGLEFITHCAYVMTAGGGRPEKWTSTGHHRWQQYHKPLLWYQKPAPKLKGKRERHPGHRRAGVRDTVFASDPKEINQDHQTPDGHKWQQSQKGFEAIVNAYTNAQDVICDPMVGSGTTILACLARGRRRVIGIDVDAEAIAKTRHRLAQAHLQKGV